MEELMREGEKSHSSDISGEPGARENVTREFGMDSLITVKSEGLFPDVSFEEDGFLFTDTGISQLPPTANGFDFDAIRKGYVENEKGAYRALLDYSRHVDAQCAVIIAPDDKGYRSLLSIGMNRNPDDSLFDLDSEISSEYLMKRRIIGIDGAKKSPLLGEKWDWIAFKYVNSLLFMPLIYRGKDAYLMLGFKEKSSNPVDFFSLQKL